MAEVEKTVYLKILKLLSVRGTHFTTEDLARALGTSKRTVYTYFQSKYDIIDQTIEFVFREIEQTNQQILRDETIPLPQRICRYIENVPDQFYIGTLIRYADDLKRYYPALWQKTDRYLAVMWDRLIALVEEGITAGVFRPVNTAVLRLMLDRSMEGLLDYECTMQAHVNFESGAKALCDILLFGLMNSPAYYEIRPLA